MWDHVSTRVSSSSGSSGVVQAVWTLPLHSVVLISNGELPLEDVTESFWKKTSGESVRMRETHRDANDRNMKRHSLPHWCRFCPWVPWAPPPSTSQCPFPSGIRSGLLHSPAPRQTLHADTPGYSGRCALAYQTHDWVQTQPEFVSDKHNQLIYSLHNTCRQCCCLAVEKKLQGILTNRFQDQHPWDSFHNIQFNNVNAFALVRNKYTSTYF